MTEQVKNRLTALGRGEVPEGYERTKVGVVPQEWEVVKLAPYLSESRVKGSTGLEAKKLTVKLWNKGVTVKNEKYQGSENTNYYIRKSGQLIYSKLDFQNCAFGIIPKHLDSYESTLDLPAFDINLSKLHPYFLLSSITQLSFYDKWGTIAANGGRKAQRISPEDFLSFPFLLPPLPEQQKIAAILSTQDKLIALKEKLIVEKQQRKKHLMQQLLTGKKRLAGFDGEWESKRLGEIFSERTERNCNSLPLLAITAKKGVVPRSEMDLKDNSSEDKSKYLKICIGDIGYNTMRMWQGVSAYSNYEGIVSPAYTILKPKAHIAAYYFSYLFKTPEVVFLFYRFSQGLVDDTRNLKYENFKKIKVYAPTDKKEQIAITSILTTADREIELFQQELEQEKQKKKALMQLLLTGIVRV